MDGVQPHITMRTSFILLLLSLLHTSNGNMCSAPQTVQFAENNKVDDVVATITVQSGVTLEFTDSNNVAFKLRVNQLLAAVVFDYETERTVVAGITCTDTASGTTLKITIVVVVQNVNDNAPVFASSLYQVDVSEAIPVGEVVGIFAATDSDKLGQLHYNLTSESVNNFKLRSPTIPELIIQSPLDYDKVPAYTMVLYVQDTPFTSTDKSYTSSTTIVVTVTDADNRPPWFKPCTTQTIGTTLICQSDGYNGRVILNVLETGPLQLKPGPVYATDGDTGINAAITYSLLSGANADLFTINPNTGNISMVKPVKSVDTIHLRVLAAQADTSGQFATTSVTISVQVKSLHQPEFDKPLYEGVVSSVGSMAIDGDKPLYIHATDKDYSEVPNPHIVYTIEGSSDFSIINGYLFMTKDLPATVLSLQVVATDTSNNESDTAELSVQVKSGFTTTTSFPMSTTNIMTTMPIVESTISSKTTVAIVSTTANVPTTSSIATIVPSTSASILSTTTIPNVPTTSSIATTVHSTSASILSTTHPSTSTATEGSVSTTKASMTSEGSSSTASTAPTPTVVIASGRYGPEDMAALGATLGVLLLVCLVVIVVLSLHLRKDKADWKKIYEVSVFRSSLGQGSGNPKKGVHYTNEAFQNDEDGGSTGSGGPDGGVSTEAIVRSSLPLHALLPDNTSEVGSDKADTEKEVKPILTKERRNEEGYKAVWFKEDIDPNAKEEVVIIPDRREEDSYEEDEPANQAPNDSVDDADLDSGLGVKMGDVPEDSEENEATSSDL